MRRMPSGLPVEDVLRYKAIIADCWLWRVPGTAGYGYVSVRGKSHRAHRWVYEQLVGPIEVGLELDHLCRVRHCVNPDHLEPVTKQENLRRGAKNWTYGPCKHGHPFEHRVRSRDGATHCSECNRISARRYQQERRQRERERPVFNNDLYFFTGTDSTYFHGERG